jgi:hypothetical protein
MAPWRAARQHKNANTSSIGPVDSRDSTKDAIGAVRFWKPLVGLLQAFPVLLDILTITQVEAS